MSRDKLDGSSVEDERVFSGMLKLGADEVLVALLVVTDLPYYQYLYGIG